MKWNRNYLLNPLFIAALGLLLLNDFWLKAAFHNELTGKLSDVSGLVVLPLFLSAFIPRYKGWVFLFTALFFCWWKSPLSETAIEWWNANLFYAVERRVDYTDLFCLLVLIPVYRYRIPTRSYLVPKAERVSLFPIMGLSVFALMATSRASHFMIREIAIQENVKTSADKARIMQYLAASNVVVQPANPIVLVKDTLESYVLENVIIGTDTIGKTYIGFRERKKGAKVYLSHIVFDEEDQRILETPNLKTYFRHYKKELTKYIERVDEQQAP